MLALGNIPQLYHQKHHRSRVNAGQVELHGHRPTCAIKDLHLHRRRLARSAEDLRHERRHRWLIFRQDQIQKAPPHQLLFRIFEDRLLPPVHRHDATARVHH